MRIETDIKLAARLYTMRDTAKRFYKDEYAERIAPYKKIISHVSKEHKIDEIKAAMKICEDDTVKASGWTVVLLMAAAVELIEPS